jgi:hypothetical protein
MPSPGGQAGLGTSARLAATFGPAGLRGLAGEHEITGYGALGILGAVQHLDQDVAAALAL